MSQLITLAILTGLLIQSSAAHITAHDVLGDLGWTVPYAGQMEYEYWALSQTFAVGDILVFYFKTGEADVARVTKEAFDACNSTNPLSVEKIGPFYYRLDSAGEYYFIGTIDRSCIFGQKLEINVTALVPSPSLSPSPTPAPVTPRSPVTYTVGDRFGWEILADRGVSYANWARNKVFMVGDVLVFNFKNGIQDVALVTREAYEICNTTTTAAVFATSPARVTLATVGEHFFTSTRSGHCAHGQRLAINVIQGSSSPAPAAGGPATAPSPASSAPPREIFGLFFITLLSNVLLAVFH